MEELGTAELTLLGASDVNGAFRGAHFEAEPQTLYRINYAARVVGKIIAPLRTFRCHSTKYLYKTAQLIPWERLLNPDRTFSIAAQTSSSTIKHSRYAALVLKDAIADYFRARDGRRPSVDAHNADIRLNLHIEHNRAIIGVDVSGGSLHRRGYKVASVQAPMQETLAAAIILLSEWDGATPLLDPMCGSGTLVAEALMRYCRIPAGYLRPRFGFELLPDFDVDSWTEVSQTMQSMIRSLPPGLIAASDIDPKSVEATRMNVRRLSSGPDIMIQICDFRELGGFENGTIITNPPYGIRLGEKSAIPRLYKEFGDFLKRKCKGSTAYVYFGDRSLLSHIGLKPAWKKPLVNGSLDGRLAKFELY